MPENDRKPSLRFKEFNDAWEQCKLKDLIRKPVTDGPHETPTYVDQGIPFLSVEAIHDGILDISKSRGYISETDNEFYNRKYKPEVNDVLITKAATIGRVAIVETDSIFNIWSPIGAIKVNESILVPRFLLYHLQLESIQKEAINSSNNGSQLNLGMKKIEEFIIKRPIVLKEQESIALLFKSIDELITLHQRKYDKLVSVKKALLDKMFPETGNDVPKIRFKGFTDAWEQRKVGEVSLLRGRIGFRGYTREDLVQAHQGAVTFSPSDIDDHGNLSLINNDYISFFKYDESPEIQVNVGDILFTKTASIGKVAYVKELKEKATINPQFALITPKAKINGYFQFISMRLSGFIDQVMGITGGSSIPTMSQEKLKELTFNTPTLNEQYKISKLFKYLDNLITLHQRKYEKLKNIKKSLLQKMFA
jgi:type I restriction enzyme S subunit